MPSTNGNDPCDEIRIARNVGAVRCGVSLHAPVTLEELAIEFGLRSIKFDEIDSRAGHALAQKILHADLAHAKEVMSKARATELSGEFFKLFGVKARFFTNGNFHRAVAPKNGFTWTPATSATFDTGVLIVSDACCGCLWVEDED